MTNTLELILQKLEKLEQGQQEILLSQKVLYRQVEALSALYHQLNFRVPLLGFRGWAISPDFGALYTELILKNKPKTILELGSGISTIIAGYCLEKIGEGHVFAVEHEERFAAAALQNIEQHGLQKFATVIHVPLILHEINGETWKWYDTSCFRHIAEIDLLVADGPPQYGNATDMARYPALPLLRKQLASPATILMDDADRENELRVADSWLKEFPITLIHHYEKAYADTERGTKIFRIE